MQSISVNSANISSIAVGRLQAKYSANGSRILRYFVDFTHKELGLHKEVSAPEMYLLQSKVDALMLAWDKKAIEHRRKGRVLSGKEAAEQMTTEAATHLANLSKILQHTLKIDDRIDWETLKDRSHFKGDYEFKEPKPQRPVTQKPAFTEPPYTIFDFLFMRKAKLREAARLRHERAVQLWQERETKADDQYNREVAAWRSRKAEYEADYAERKRVFLTEQKERNAQIDALAGGVASGEQQSVIEHVGLVLERSNYNEMFQKSFEIDYVPAEKTVLIEYTLPSPDNMPVLKSAKFVPSTGEIKETYISEREQKINFDLVCYQICLRTIHEVLEADEHGNIDKVLFNGITDFVDRTTGQDTRTCIMSVLVSRSDFEKIDLSRVDPKACFKSLKGVSAASLAAMAPVPPVMNLNREDRRFIEARSTVGGLSEATNLAAMDWGDFEHLVRELFEKEFSARGGEVKITQASSDGGVDAVAFDPDPITGGKIVIQAKRYTKTVGVTAVRDLYGTMQHEGASRGILITTADYGPDAYKFAAGMPITLFTGGNLLHLLEKHGYSATIDIRQARKDLNLR